MKTITTILTILLSTLTYSQNNFGFTSALDASVKASARLGICPNITITQDYEQFRIGCDYSYSLSKYQEYRSHTIQGLIGINMHSASIELGIGQHFNNNKCVLAWSFGARFRYNNRIFTSIKVGSDFANFSVGYTLFKYNDRK